LIDAPLFLRHAYAFARCFALLSGFADICLMPFFRYATPTLMIDIATEAYATPLMPPPCCHACFDADVTPPALSCHY